MTNEDLRVNQDLDLEQIVAGVETGVKLSMRAHPFKDEETALRWQRPDVDVQELAGVNEIAQYLIANIIQYLDDPLIDDGFGADDAKRKEWETAVLAKYGQKGKEFIENNRYRVNKFRSVSELFLLIDTLEDGKAKEQLKMLFPHLVRVHEYAGGVYKQLTTEAKRTVIAHYHMVLEVALEILLGLNVDQTKIAEIDQTMPEMCAYSLDGLITEVSSLPISELNDLVSTHEDISSMSLPEKAEIIKKLMNVVVITGWLRAIHSLLEQLDVVMENDPDNYRQKLSEKVNNIFQIVTEIFEVLEPVRQLIIEVRDSLDKSNSKQNELANRLATQSSDIFNLRSLLLSKSA